MPDNNTASATTTTAAANDTNIVRRTFLVSNTGSRNTLKLTRTKSLVFVGPLVVLYDRDSEHTPIRTHQYTAVEEVRGYYEVLYSACNGTLIVFRLDTATPHDLFTIPDVPSDDILVDPYGVQ